MPQDFVIIMHYYNNINKYTKSMNGFLIHISTLYAPISNTEANSELNQSEMDVTSNICNGDSHKCEKQLSKLC